MFLLYPLERSINAFENINMDRFLLENEFLKTEQIEYCNIEENYAITSEVPYFEVTLLGLEESEGVFVKAHLMTVITFSLFSVLYHIYLFVLPLLKENLSYKLKDFIIKYTGAVLLS